MLGAILLGVLTGLNVAVIGMGIVLIFKTGKYINFAQAQLGVVPMLIMGKLVLVSGLSWFVAFPIALLLGAAIAVACEVLVVRPLSKLGPQPVLVGTLGVAQVLLGLAYVKQLSAPQVKLISDGYPVPFDTRFKIGGAFFFAQHVLTVIAVPVVAVALWIFLSRTLTGKSIRAIACNEQAGRLAGLSIRRLSIIAWALAGAMATVGAVLAAPNSPGFDPSSVGPMLMFSALGAAALAGFSSFPQVVGAAVLLTVVQAIVVHQTADTSKGVLALFLTTLVGLIARRNSGALREAASSLRSGLIRPGMTPALRATREGRIAAGAMPAVLVGFALLAGFIWRNSAVNLYRFDQILIIAAAVAAISLLGGLTGQMSLGQAAFLGLGAAIAAKMIHGGATSLVANLVVAGLVTGLAAMLLALPSFRGGSLMTAVTTLGFGVLASSWLFNQTWLNPAVSDFSGGSSVRPQTLPGIGKIEAGRTVYFVVLAGVVILLALGSWFKRSPLGIRASAARFSESGARALGLNVLMLRLGAVAVVGVITGAIGALDISANQAFNPVIYNAQVSLVILSLAVIGGLGSTTGAVVAAAMIFGVPLFLSDWIQSWGGNPVQVQLFLGGAFLVLNLVLNPGGLASVAAGTFERLFAPRRRSLGEHAVTGAAQVPTVEHPPRVPDLDMPVLRSVDVSRSFGVLRALDSVSLMVGSHEIVGLIGNNGAGKTTLLNCIAGDMRHEGCVELFGHRSQGRTAQRARTGLGRTFQDAHLFAGLTTREVLQLAARQRVRGGAAGHSPDVEQSARARADDALGDLGLEPYALTLTSDLPTGVKRIVELGIQLLRRPGLILLDEPAAGLSQAEVRLFGPRLRDIVDRLGCSVLMIEHDLPLMLSIADRIYCLELGRVIAEGTPQQIRIDPRVIESYFGSPDGVGARRSTGLEAGSSEQEPLPTQLDHIKGGTHVR